MDLFVCHICQNKFYSFLDLSIHMKNYHNIDEFKICRICLKSQDSISALRNHLNTHGLTMSYQCIVCDIVFNSVGDSVKHYWNVQENSDNGEHKKLLEYALSIQKKTCLSNFKALRLYLECPRYNLNHSCESRNSLQENCESGVFNSEDEAF
ncbi:UNVERIFIED_CONTAM: hypothetical protein RMT77_015378 [Armadillidium vulgare]